MSFDEEHLDDHHECRGEIDRLQGVISRLRSALVQISTHGPMERLGSYGRQAMKTWIRWAQITAADAAENKD